MRQCPLVDSHVIVGLGRSVHYLAVEICALRRFLLRQMLHLHLCLATQAASLPVLVHRAHELLQVFDPARQIASRLRIHMTLLGARNLIVNGLVDYVPYLHVGGIPATVHVASHLLERLLFQCLVSILDMRFLYQRIDLFLLEVNLLVQGVDDRLVESLLALLLNYLPYELHGIVPLRVKLGFQMGLLLLELLYPALHRQHQIYELFFLHRSGRHYREGLGHLQWNAAQLVVDHFERRVIHIFLGLHRFMDSVLRWLQVPVPPEGGLILDIGVQINVFGEVLLLVCVLFAQFELWI